MPAPPRRALAGLLVAAALLLAAEGLLRVALGPLPPAVRVYRALGERERYLVPEGPGLTAAHQDDPVLLRTGELQVVALGGSSVHGGSPGVRRGGEFPGIAARHLRRPVANLGSPGLDSFDHVEILRELAQLPAGERPQLVLLYAGHNDFGNARFQARYGSRAAGLAAHAQSALEQVAVYVHLRRLLRPPEGRARERGVPLDLPPLTEPQWEAAGRDLVRNLDQMALITADMGARLLVLTPVSDLLRRPVDLPCADPPCAAARFDAALALRTIDPAAAAAGLRSARDADRVGLRAPSSAQAAMLALPQRWPHVAAVDLEARLPAAPDAPVPTPALFDDGLHFTAWGHQQVGAIAAEAARPLLPQAPRPP